MSPGSRRLLTYRKLQEGEVSSVSRIKSATDDPNGVTADELNEFRRLVCVASNMQYSRQC